MIKGLFYSLTLLVPSNGHTIAYATIYLCLALKGLKDSLKFYSGEFYLKISFRNCTVIIVINNDSLNLHKTHSNKIARNPSKSKMSP